MNVLNGAASGDDRVADAAGAHIAFVTGGQLRVACA
jgi:hypothetical protein